MLRKTTIHVTVCSLYVFGDTAIYRDMYSSYIWLHIHQGKEGYWILVGQQYWYSLLMLTLT